MENIKKNMFWLGLVLTMLCLLFVFPIKNNKGKSMTPALSEDNVSLYINNKIPGVNLKRFDIVYADRKGDNQVIKRVVGLPGEHIEIRGFDIYINGNKIDNPYIIYNTEKPISEPFDNIILEEDEYFLMGDNQAVSRDSRSYGPVKDSEIIGKYLWHMDI